MRKKKIKKSTHQAIVNGTNLQFCWSETLQSLCFKQVKLNLGRREPGRINEKKIEDTPANQDTRLKTTTADQEDKQRRNQVNWWTRILLPTHLRE